MIPDLVYTSRDFYISNQLKSSPICSLLELSATGLHTRNLCHLVNILTNKADVCIREKSSLCLAGLSSLLSSRIFKSGISPNSTRGQSAKKLTT